MHPKGPVNSKCLVSTSYLLSDHQNNFYQWKCFLKQNSLGKHHLVSTEVALFKGLASLCGGDRHRNSPALGKLRQQDPENQHRLILATAPGTFLTTPHGVCTHLQLLLGVSAQQITDIFIVDLQIGSPDQELGIFCTLREAEHEKMAWAKPDCCSGLSS